MEKYSVLLSLNNISNRIADIPGSKSYTNRAILIAAIANGTSIIKNFLRSDDTTSMICGLRNLGIEIIDNDAELIIKGNNGKFNNIISNKLFCGIAGTTSRFLTGLTLLIDQDIEITGEKKILERPIGDLVDAMKKNGVKIDYLDRDGSLPLKIYGQKNIKNIMEIDGSISSQFISALLMIAPRIIGGLEINIIGDQVSQSYIDITLSIMKEFGVEVQNDNYKKYVIKNQEYKPREYIVEGDWSGASYFFAMAGLFMINQEHDKVEEKTTLDNTSNQKIQINNVYQNSVQGDAKFIEILKLFGLNVVFDKTSAIVCNTVESIRDNISINMSQMPDTAMTAMILASMLGKTVEITGLSTLKDKECDRIEVPKQQLAKFGIKCTTTKNSIIVHGKTFNSKEVIEVDTFDDHRIAMAFSLLAIRQKILIKDAGVVNKSFPNYWEELAKFGFNIEKIIV